MIPANNIKAVMVALSTYLGVTFLRGDQGANVPSYPYFNYKNITINQESAHQDVIDVTENDIDPTSADVARYEKTEEVISLNFYDKDKITDIRTYAEQSLQWFKSIAGKETCKENDIIPRMINTVIQDRSLFQEAYWENRLGFDIRFDYSGKYTQTIEAVEEIQVTPTIDGEEKSKIIIQET